MDREYLDKKLNSCVISISLLLLAFFVLFILGIIYSPCWSANDKLFFGFVGILILLLTLVNFPVGYFFKEKIVLRNFDVTILFYTVVLIGVIIGLGIVRIILTEVDC